MASTKPNNNSSRQVVATQQWSGPLPPPSALQQFNEIIPNGAERILSMLEQEQSSRIDLEKNALAFQANDNRRAHYLGWSIAIAAIVACLVSVYIGAHWSVSIALVSLPVAAIIKAIIRK